MIYNYFIRPVFGRRIISKLLKSSPHTILILFTQKKKKRKKKQARGLEMSWLTRSASRETLKKGCGNWTMRIVLRVISLAILCAPGKKVALTN